MATKTDPYAGVDRVAAPVAAVLVLGLGLWIYFALNGKASVPIPTGKGRLLVKSVPAGAIVSINGLSGGQTPLTIHLNPGEYDIDIQLTDYIPFTKTVTIVAGETVEINHVLQSPVFTANLTGQVTEGGTGTPLGGVQVILGINTTQTDATGNYGFTTVPLGNYNLSFAKDGYVSEGRTIALTNQSLVINTILQPVTSPPPPPPPVDIIQQIIDTHGFKIIAATYLGNICTIQYVTGLVVTSNIQLVAATHAIYKGDHPTPLAMERNGEEFMGDAGGDFWISSVPGLYTTSVQPNASFINQMVSQGLLALPLKYIEASMVVFATDSRTGAWGSVLASDIIPVSSG